MTMVHKICILSLICLTIPSLLCSFYLYRRQADEFYSQLINEQLTAVEQAANNVDTTLSSISQLVMDLAYSESLTNYLGKMHRTDLLRYPTWSEKMLNEIIASIRYSLKYRDLGINSASIYVPSPPFPWKEIISIRWTAWKILLSFKILQIQRKAAGYIS